MLVVFLAMGDSVKAVLLNTCRIDYCAEILDVRHVQWLDCFQLRRVICILRPHDLIVAIPILLLLRLHTLSIRNQVVLLVHYVWRQKLLFLDGVLRTLVYDYLSLLAGATRC